MIKVNGKKVVSRTIVLCSAHSLNAIRRLHFAVVTKKDNLTLFLIYTETTTDLVSIDTTLYFKKERKKTLR